MCAKTDSQEIVTYEVIHGTFMTKHKAIKKTKAGFTRSSFLQKESCLNILSVCKVPRKIIEQDCWQYCAIKILPRVKALFKKKVRLAAILLGIERGSIFQQDFNKFSVENAIVGDRRSKDVNK